MNIKPSFKPTQNALDIAVHLGRTGHECWLEDAQQMLTWQHDRIKELENLCDSADRMIGLLRVEIEFLRQHLKAYGVSIIENSMKEVYAKYTEELGKAQEK
jgi:hypothetical protein